MDIGHYKNADRMRIAAKIYNFIEQFFVFENEDARECFERDFEGFVSAVADGCGRYDFFMEAQRLMASLNNGHTNFFDGEVFSSMAPLPFTCRCVDGRWVVMSSDVDVIKPGDILKKVEGRLAEDFFLKHKAYISASSDRQRRHSLTRIPYLFHNIGKFTFSGADGQDEVVDVRSCESHVQSVPDFHCSKINDALWLIKIHSFQRDNVSEEIIDAIKKHGMHSIIFDVRENDGGCTPSDLMKFLVDKPYCYFSDKTPLHIGLSKAYRSMHDLFTGSADDRSIDMKLLDALSTYGGITHLYQAGPRVLPEGDTFAGKIAVLIGPGTISAAEDFVMPFKQTQRGLIVGETTYGSSGQPAFADLGGGVKMRVGTRLQFFPDGSRFEGVGIAPDIEVIPTIDDIRQARDPVLLTAVKALSEE